MSAIAAGTVIAGDYRILRPLSAGGMGAVYVALQLSTGRERALKVMLGELAGNDDLKRRFVQEARIGSQIDSDHAVEVVAAGIDAATGAPWLAMELLEGEDLASCLARTGPLPPARVLELFEQMTHALGAAHARGIVHRDLKLENLFLARSRRSDGSFMLKVLDFGIAKLLGAAKTSATAAMGTPLWMAPEQTQPGSSIAPAADVWAMGLIAFRALTGKLFWKTASDANASSMMVLREVVFEPIAVASARAGEIGGAPLPPGFDAWFARCVNRDPAARFADARGMQAELRRVLASAPVKGMTALAEPSWQATQYSPGGPMTHVAPMAAAPAASFVSVPPIVQSGPRSAPFGVRALPPAASVRRPRSSTGLYAGLGLVGAALAIGAVVLATSGPSRSKSSKKRSDPDAAEERAPRVSAEPTRPSPSLATPEPPEAALPEPRPPETPFASAQQWRGHYMCGQGRTALLLRIDSVTGSNVDAVFEFNHAGSASAGSYRMSGRYHPATRELKLLPGEWIKRPAGYETVGMQGFVSADDTAYTGTISDPRCGAFTVTLGAPVDSGAVLP